MFYKTLMAAVAAALVAAPAAQADAPAFEQYLNDHQINIGPYVMNRSALPSLGVELCGMLRAGSSFDQTAAYASSGWMDGPGVTAAAQRTMCPETLH